MEPTISQLKALYLICYTLTEYARFPITIVRLDDHPHRSGFLYIQFGREGSEEYVLLDREGQPIEE